MLFQRCRFPQLGFAGESEASALEPATAAATATNTTMDTDDNATFLLRSTGTP